MNKKGIALCAVVAVGVIWTGAAWLAGKQIESEKDGLLDKLNTQLAQRFPEQQFHVEAVDYHRGIFSSSTKLVITSSASTRSDDPSVRKEVVFNEHIEHGPFPLSLLKRISIMPSLAYIRSELVKNDATQPVFMVAEESLPLTADSKIGLSGRVSSNIHMSALSLPSSSNGEVMKTGPLDIYYSSDKELKNITASIAVPMINLAFKDKQGVFNSLKVNGFSYKGNSILGASGLYTGNGSGSIKQFSYSTDEGIDFSAADFSMDSDAKEKQGKIDGSSRYQISSIVYNKASLGSLDLSMSAKNIDAKALNSLVQAYSQVYQSNSSNPNVLEAPEIDTHQLAELFRKSVLGIIQHSPVLAIDSLKIKNDAGESQLSFSTTLKNGGMEGFTNNDFLSAFTDNVEQLDVHVALNRPMMKSLVQGLYQANGMPDDSAQKISQQAIDGVSGMGQMYHLTLNKGDTITSDLTYHDKSITLNSEKMPLNEFLSKIFGTPYINPR